MTSHAATPYGRAILLALNARRAPGAILFARNRSERRAQRRQIARFGLPGDVPPAGGMPPVFAQTVPAHVLTKRRAASKVAARSRRLNRTAA